METVGCYLEKMMYLAKMKSLRETDYLTEERFEDGVDEAIGRFLEKHSSASLSDVEWRGAPMTLTDTAIGHLSIVAYTGIDRLILLAPAELCEKSGSRYVRECKRFLDHKPMAQGKTHG